MTVRYISYATPIKGATVIPANYRHAGEVMRMATQSAIAFAQNPTSDDTAAIEKAGYGSTETDGSTKANDDVTTKLDGKVDDLYHAIFNNELPHTPVVSEDGKDTTASSETYLTVDGIDGTRSLAKGLLREVGTMSSLVIDGHITCAYVGNVGTGEMIGYEFDGPVMRYRGNETLNLSRLAGQPLDKVDVLRRSRPAEYSPLFDRLFEPNSIFRDTRIVNGSLGVSMWSLWTREVGGAILPDSFYQTPWDNTPIYGIMQRLGFGMYVNCDGRLIERPLTPPRRIDEGFEAVFLPRAFARQVANKLT